MQTMTKTGLIRICAWCQRLVDDNNKSHSPQWVAWLHRLIEGRAVSHTICRSCAIIERKKLAQYRAEKVNGINGNEKTYR